MRRVRQGDEWGFLARRELRSRVGSRVPAHPAGPGAGHRAPGLRPRFAHPWGFTGSDAAAGCCRCLGKSSPSQNATPARWGLLASRVLVSLAPGVVHRFPKRGKKINPTILSKPIFLCTTGSFSKKRIVQWKTPPHRENPSEGRKSFYI